MAPKKKTKAEPKAKTGAERQRAYHKKMTDAGFKRLGVWVPESEKEEFDKLIGRLQRKWDKANLYPT